MRTYTRFGSSLSPHSFTCHPIFMVHAHCVFLGLPRHLHSLPLPHLVSDHPVLPSARQLHLPGRGGRIPCATPLRTLAPWPRTTLPQDTSPTSTTSRRLMSTTPRNPLSSSGPPVTPTAMTSPSARCSLTLAEDEPIALKKKACRPVCRRQSVKIERGDPLFAPHFDSLVSSVRETQRHNSESEQIRILLGHQREQITVKQRFENTKSRPIMTEEALKS